MHYKYTINNVALKNFEEIPSNFRINESMFEILEFIKCLIDNDFRLIPDIIVHSGKGEYFNQFAIYELKVELKFINLEKDFLKLIYYQLNLVYKVSVFGFTHIDNENADIVFSELDKLISIFILKHIGLLNQIKPMLSNFLIMKVNREKNETTFISLRQAIER